jgi:hypothetical protein
MLSSDTATDDNVADFITGIKVFGNWGSVD